jgi:hypothetical protein
MRNTLAGVHSHTHADKIDHFIHQKNNYFIYNLLQLTIDMKATTPGTLCIIIIHTIFCHIELIKIQAPLVICDLFICGLSFSRSNYLLFQITNSSRHLLFYSRFCTSRFNIWRTYLPWITRDPILNIHRNLSYESFYSTWKFIPHEIVQK